MKETVAQEALRLLSAVPKNKWITDVLTNEVDKCCAIGHYTRLKSSNHNNYSPTNCSDWSIPSSLRVVSKLYLVDYTIATVNNRSVDKYQQKTPKGRVIACLKDMIKAGY